MGDVNSHLTYGSLVAAESLTQTPSRSVQPFLQGSLVTDRQTDRPTDHPTRTYLRSTAMRPNHHRIEMKICVVVGLQEVVLRFEFYQNR